MAKNNKNKQEVVMTGMEVVFIICGILFFVCMIAEAPTIFGWIAVITFLLWQLTKHPTVVQYTPIALGVVIFISFFLFSKSKMFGFFGGLVGGFVFWLISKVGLWYLVEWLVSK